MSNTNITNGSGKSTPKYHTAKSLYNMKLPKSLILWYASPVGGISILFGRPNSKKSWLLLGLSHAICSGATTYLDRPINAKNKRVIYISFEDNSIDIRNRLKTMGVPEKEMHEFYLISTDKCLPQDILPTIKEIINHHGPVDLVVIDPLRSLYNSGDPTNVADVNGGLDNLNHLAAKYQFAAIGIAHTTKGSVEWDMDKMKGAQEQSAKARAVYLLDDGWFGTVKANSVPSDDKAYELKFNDTNCTWSGDIMDWEYKERISGTKITLGQKRYNIDWPIIFSQDKKLSRADILVRVKGKYPIKSDRTIDTYIASDLESVSHGVYKIK